MNIGEIILYIILGIILTAILFKMVIYNKYIKPKAEAKKQVRQLEEDYEDNLKELENVKDKK